MPRPHSAAIIEDAWHRQVAGAMRRRGWGTRVLAHTGYGSVDRVRVLGRVLMTRRPYRPAAARDFFFRLAQARKTFAGLMLGKRKEEKRFGGG